MSESGIQLSAIIPTNQSWPNVRPALDAIRDQVLETGGEVLVSAGYGVGVPTDLGEPFVVLHDAGTNVFELRAAGVAQARGDVVAILEDHTYVEPGWSKALLETFERHPEADGVVGGVTNGAPKLVDRASFLVTWAPLLAPVREVPLHRCPPPGVVSYRREVLPDTPPPSGWLEYQLVAELREAGRLVAAEDVVVDHVQDLGMRAFLLQFVAGRGFTGLDHHYWPPVPRRKQVADAARRAWILIRQTRDALANHPEWKATPAEMGLVAAMCTANAAGQILGIFAGTGDSLRHLE